MELDLFEPRYMRVIVIGTLSFIAWSVFSNYWYVCKIRGLCDEATYQTVTSLQDSPADSQIASNSEVDGSLQMGGKTTDTIPEVNVFETVYINFFSGSDSIKNVVELTPIIDQLKLATQAKEGAQVLLVGHTDDRGEADFNYLLGLQRAQSLKKLLINQGMDQEIIHVASRGEKDPLVENISEVDRKKNRRVEILIY